MLKLENPRLLYRCDACEQVFTGSEVGLVEIEHSVSASPKGTYIYVRSNGKLCNGKVWKDSIIPPKSYIFACPHCGQAHPRGFDMVNPSI